MEALLHGGEPVSMDNLKRITMSLPYATPEEPGWPKDSYLKALIEKGAKREQWTTSEFTSNTVHDVTMYFLNEFARVGANRQSSGILSTFTGMAQPFMSGPVKELFCTETNFTPEFSRQGAIIILNLPLDEWEEIGRTAQLAFKYIWQKAVL